MCHCLQAAASPSCGMAVGRELAYACASKPLACGLIDRGKGTWRQGKLRPGDKPSVNFAFAMPNLPFASASISSDCSTSTTAHPLHVCGRGLSRLLIERNVTLVIVISDRIRWEKWRKVAVLEKGNRAQLTAWVSGAIHQPFAGLYYFWTCRRHQRYPRKSPTRPAHRASCASSRQSAGTCSGILIIRSGPHTCDECCKIAGRMLQKS